MNILMSLMTVVSLGSQVARADWISELTGDAARSRTNEARKDLANVRGHLQHVQTEITETENTIKMATSEIQKKKEEFQVKLKIYKNEINQEITKITDHISDQQILSQKISNLVKGTNTLLVAFQTLREKLTAAKTSADAALQLAHYLEQNQKDLLRFSESYQDLISELSPEERIALTEVDKESKQKGMSLNRSALSILSDQAHSNTTKSPLLITERIIETLTVLSVKADQQSKKHSAYLTSLKTILSAYEEILGQLN